MVSDTIILIQAYASTPLTYVDVMWFFCPVSATLLPLIDYLSFNECAQTLNSR